MSSVLLEQQDPLGFWEGELSSSALSTATAVFSLYLLDATLYGNQISKGLNWLKTHVNDDGAAALIAAAVIGSAAVIGPVATEQRKSAWEPTVFRSEGSRLRLPAHDR